MPSADGMRDAFFFPKNDQSGLKMFFRRGWIKNYWFAREDFRFQGTWTSAESLVLRPAGDQEGFRDYPLGNGRNDGEG